MGGRCSGDLRVDGNDQQVTRLEAGDHGWIPPQAEMKAVRGLDGRDWVLLGAKQEMVDPSGRSPAGTEPLQRPGRRLTKARPLRRPSSRTSSCGGTLAEASGRVSPCRKMDWRAPK